MNTLCNVSILCDMNSLCDMNKLCNMSAICVVGPHVCRMSLSAGSSHGMTTRLLLPSLLLLTTVQLTSSDNYAFQKKPVNPDNDGSQDNADAPRFQRLFKDSKNFLFDEKDSKHVTGEQDRGGSDGAVGVVRGVPGQGINQAQDIQQPAQANVKDFKLKGIPQHGQEFQQPVQDKFPEKEANQQVLKYYQKERTKAPEVNSINRHHEFGVDNLPVKDDVDSNNAREVGKDENRAGVKVQVERLNNGRPPLMSTIDSEYYYYYYYYYYY